MHLRLFAVGLAYLLWLPVSAQPVDTSYLFQHAKPLSLSQQEDPAFAMLDTVVPAYRFFFTAEQHWRSINTQIQFRFLRYLHQNAGVRHLIVEGGFSYGFLLNEYLRSGDERLLQKIMKDVPICPDDQMELYRNIYDYNQHLDPADKIQVTGIDLEHSPELSLHTLYKMLPDETPPRKIQKHIDRLRELHESPYFDPKEVKSFFRKLATDMEKNSQHYVKYWEEDFPLFSMIVENTLQGFQFTWLRSSLFQSSWQEREARMYRNFLIVEPDLKPGNYYAQFGALHTDIARSQIWDFPSLANRLNFLPNSPVNGEVLTISRYVRQMTNNYERLGESELLHTAVASLEERFEDSIVLLSLIGNNSPFREMSRTFQFMMLIDEDLEQVSCE